MSQTAAAAPPREISEFAETLRTVVYALATALAVRVLLFQPFTIPSQSMQPGLLVGDYVVITKFDYGWSRHSIPFSPALFEDRLFARPVERGDVVVFKKPGEERGEDVIKRVVGVPGDRVQVIGGAVHLNGRPVARIPDGAGADPGDSAVSVDQHRERLGGRDYVTLDRGPGREGDDTAVHGVPQGFYFVMGDNRDNSADSRWPRGQGMGLVPAENVLGKARLVLLSWEPGASVLKPWTWIRLRAGRVLREIS